PSPTNRRRPSPPAPAAMSPIGSVSSRVSRRSEAAGAHGPKALENEPNKEGNPMAYDFIEVERDGPITTITLNRPEVMNALHRPANLEMEEAVKAFAAD